MFWFETLLTIIILFLITVFILITLIDFVNFLKGRPPFLPSTRWEVDRILSIYKFKSDDKVVDLGSGNGKILIKLARKGVKSTGLELNPILALWSKFLILVTGLSNKIKIRNIDYLKEDFSKYNVFILYGINNIMPKIEKKFVKEAREGSVLISNKFKLPKLKPKKNISTTYLYKKEERARH